MKAVDINGVQLKWLGHSSFKFSFGGKVVYIDPFQVDETEKAYLLLISHGHYDHCSIADIAKLVKEDTLIITTPDTTSKFAGKVDGGKLKLARPGESFSFGGIEVKAVPAYNINKDFHPGMNEWVGYIIKINNVRFYHSGDTDLIPEMSEVKADVAMLPVSGTYVMTAEEAAQAAKKIMPKIAIPMHYGRIIGSRADAEKFKKLCDFCEVKILD